MTEFDRRQVLAFLGTICVSSCAKREPGRPVTIVDFDNAGRRQSVTQKLKVVRSDSEWRDRLSAEQFYVTRRGSTDTPFTGTYFRLHDAGIFRCIGCATALFSSQTKFDSDTGWPSFWSPLATENIRTQIDRSILPQRTEVLCALCDAHLGHLFDDGPPPTGLRYCMNESALHFVQA